MFPDRLDEILLEGVHRQTLLALLDALFLLVERGQFLLFWFILTNNNFLLYWFSFQYITYLFVLPMRSVADPFHFDIFPEKQIVLVRTSVRTSSN